jgi:hypothetical protein
MTIRMPHIRLLSLSCVLFSIFFISLSQYVMVLHNAVLSTDRLIPELECGFATPEGPTVLPNSQTQQCNNHLSQFTKY